MGRKKKVVKGIAKKVGVAKIKDSKIIPNYGEGIRYKFGDTTAKPKFGDKANKPKFGG